ncbi:MAG: YicC family protein [Oscillospiraceae bacterium]|nr:YicC family protein [Oscillospiraceae bacterium]
MIKSMTGYGSAKGNAAGFEISVELKSVNNRYLETSVRMPRSFLFAEEAVKSTVQRHISRGKVDVFVNINAVSVDDVKVTVNESLLKGYMEAVKKIAEEYGLAEDLSALSAARFPDVLQVERNDLDSEAISAGICTVLEEALNDFDAMREREGEKLCADVLSRLATIDGYVTRVEQESPTTVDRYRQRLEKKMAEVLGTAGIETDRILAEAAIYADHIAVDEETVRLRSHMAQLNQMIRGASPIGRKIDFLIQEFNREANTIGSKCQNSDLAHVVVDLKSEIEKIREQIQNIE